MKSLSIKHTIYSFISGWCFVLALGLGSCSKMIEVPMPSDEIFPSLVFADSLTAQAAANGMYSYMYNKNGTAGSSIGTNLTTVPAMTADELIYIPSSAVFDQFEVNNILEANANNLAIWTDMYKAIYLANSIIEGTASSTSISQSLKNELTGEAKFVRAFCHFYLVNLYGDVPLITTTNVSVTALRPRDNAAVVKAQIIKDLTEAKGLLSDSYTYSGGERIRPNKYAASALLARVYLYGGEWKKAEDESDVVIAASNLYGLVDLASVFLKNNKEAIWQFLPNLTNPYPYITKSFYTTTSAVYVLRDELLTALNKESADKRKATWTKSLTVSGVTYYYPNKYKSYLVTAATEYDVMLRLSEQYLIKAEACARQDNLPAAITAVDSIRKRAGEPLLKNTNPTIQKDSLLTVIAREWQVEFMTELGHRWLNLKRTNTMTAVLSAAKPGLWKDYAQWYPIPQTAIASNPNLVQNEGYNK